MSRQDNLAARHVSAWLFDQSGGGGAGVAESGRSGFPRRDLYRSARRPGSETYRRVTLRGLPASGLLDGERDSTRLTKSRIKLTGSFREPAHRRGFEEAMAWYHIDAAVRYVESLGYRGAKAVFREPIQVNARGTRQDNSWYSPGLRTLTLGTGSVDDAEDGETILHEFGHALQDAICPGFGQSVQAAAMGEGFGDYFAGSFFAERKPASLKNCVMSWDAFEISEAEPPCLRRLDAVLTYESFDHSEDADEHDNGVIWSATLWDIRGAIGRKAADRVILESHFQLDGFTTLRGRPARWWMPTGISTEGGTRNCWWGSSTAAVSGRSSSRPGSVAYLASRPRL